MSLHSQQTANHLIESWTYASASARQNATGFLSTDVGRIAWQSDVGAYYRLTGNSPVGWFALSPVFNITTSAQTPTAGTRTYVLGTSLPAGKLLAGTFYKWTIAMSKTAAGVGTTVWDICFGTNGTTADTARCSFTGPIETAAIDTAIVEIDALVRSVSATGTVEADLRIASNLVTTGFKNFAGLVTSATFDTTVVGTIAGVCITPGASDVITIQLATAQAYLIG